MKHLIFFPLLISTFFTSKAIKMNDVQISLLTIPPYNNKVYTMYGHTALHIYNLKDNIDIVFNWGSFDFKTPKFLYHFLTGKTDYYLSTIDYNQFIQYYHILNIPVIEQILYITPISKKYLLQTISINLKPQNRIYRYNVFKDNCSTRIRNIIEKAIGMPLNNLNNFHSNTIRKLIHSCFYSYSWLNFGIDLLIGSEADKFISKRESLFLPMELKKTLDSVNYNFGIPLVMSTSQSLSTNCKKNIHSSFFYSPIKISWIIFYLNGMLVIAMGTIIYKNKKSKITRFISKITKICFAFLFFLVAICGCFLLFFVLFSFHPCTSSNWNLFWLHPFHFIAFAGYFLKKATHWITKYHWINLILLFTFLLGKSCIPQNLNLAIICPYIYSLILGSSLYLIHKI